MSQDAVLNKYNEGESKFEEEVSKYLEMNWREITCQRTVGDGSIGAGNLNNNNFANGIQDFLFSVSGSTNAFIPALSYFCIDLELQKLTAGAAPRPPVLADDITLSNCVGDALYNNTFFRMGGQDVSTAQSFIPQQGALKRRIDQSGAWLYNVGRNASWIDSDFTRRLNVISKNGVYHQDGLLDTDAITPIPINAATTFALGALVTVGGYTVSGTVTVTENLLTAGVRVGDYITLPDRLPVTNNAAVGAPTTFAIPPAASSAYQCVITAIAPNGLTATVAFPPGVVYQTVDAIVGGGVYRKADPESGRYKQKVIWQPPIGIFNSYQPINSSELKFSLNPNANYKSAAVQTSKVNQVAGTDYSLHILNVRFYACQVKLAMPMNTIVDMPINEIQVQNKPLGSGQNSNLDFIVPPSTYGIAIFFQSNAAGTNTLLPPTTFSSSKNYITLQVPPGPYNVADLNSLQVTYGGVSKTSTLYTSYYDDNQNFAVQRWIESLAYASNWNNPGGAENFNDWIRSPVYFYDFSRDRTDSSSYVNVQVNFNQVQEPATNMFIAAFYTRLVRAEYANGQLTQLTAVNA
jgi:hypothetical protein